ncbi:MAG: hypothetical protein OEW87_10860 [Flavobacteriaceae bacterium]|nr:hypothetical protein [Flavobacteriaceae bacterium]
MTQLKKISTFIVLLALASCAKFSTTTTAKNSTQPVMLGPIHSVATEKTKPLHKKADFDITVENSVVTSGGQYHQTTYVTQESSEKIDANLMKLVDSKKDRIVVDTLFLKSARGCFFIFCSSQVDYSGIEGAVYSKKKGKK